MTEPMKTPYRVRRMRRTRRRFKRPVKTPRTRTGGAKMLRVDPDDLQRCLDDLSRQHGDLEVLPADSVTGSVTIICQDGDMFRFNVDSVMSRVGRALRRTRGLSADPEQNPSWA